VIQRAPRDAVALGARPLVVELEVNGRRRALALDARATLLDVLRDMLALTGTKKGCDQGQCGACTVLVNGRRVLACLALAVAHQGDRIQTIEGLARGDELHPMQAAFLACDAFQCGYCTPGQILSAVSLIDEARRRVPSHATPAGAAPPGPEELTDDEIRERMSGNICRCGAYPNIVEAVRSQCRKAAPGAPP
jgi:xanthine dehydrogenase YagT iron-sulfur-binding subunit